MIMDCTNGEINNGTSTALFGQINHFQNHLLGSEYSQFIQGAGLTTGYVSIPQQNNIMFISIIVH